MSFEVETVRTFDKQIKRLAKRYPSLKKYLVQLREKLVDDPFQGVALGKDCYKIRFAISSKNKGKSGGARVITNVHVVGRKVFLLSIYDKRLKSNLNEGELDALLLQIEN